ncbi:helix-turn-helix domain-containing protein [Streptomyces sp. NPDC051956]|uniref:helix-turn-helix domain-containing protein n=1 Tax=Streptomyces sp. NPDC051956 TaxID=3365677 RepID=UPI0037CF7934
MGLHLGKLLERLQQPHPERCPGRSCHPHDEPHAAALLHQSVEFCLAPRFGWTRRLSSSGTCWRRWCCDSRTCTSASGGAREPSGAFRAFHAAVERDFAESRTVADYARALGYSSRTLNRACLAAAGVTAKPYLDERSVLEARRRLLFRTELPTAAVGERLGFPHHTAFSKFFRHHTGRDPQRLPFAGLGTGLEPVVKVLVTATR